MLRGKTPHPLKSLNVVCTALSTWLNLAAWNCMGLQIGKALPTATVLRHIWLSAHQVFAKRSHTHRDNPLPSKMTQHGLAITEVAVNNGGVFWLRNISSRKLATSFRSEADFDIGVTFFVLGLAFFVWQPGHQINARNVLPTKNRSNLKKSYPKSIKNSSHNPFSKLDTSPFQCISKKTTKSCNIHQNSSKLQQDFMYKKSKFWKNTIF